MVRRKIKLTTNSEVGSIRCSVGSNIVSEEYELNISVEGYKFKTIKANGLLLKRCKHGYTLTEFLMNSPRIKFTNQSMLEGNLLVRMISMSPLVDGIILLLHFRKYKN